MAKKPLRVTDDEQLWTKHDVAKYLNLEVRAVERMPIPRLHLPGTGKKPIVRFDRDQVKAWIEAWRTRPFARKAV